MSLQVARKNSEEPWHLIREKYWGPSNQYHLQTLMIRFFCEDNARDRTPGKWKSTHLTIKPFEKDVHKKKMCENCVKGIKEYNKSRKGVEANPSRPNAPLR